MYWRYRWSKPRRRWVRVMETNKEDGDGSRSMGRSGRRTMTGQSAAIWCAAERAERLENDPHGVGAAFMNEHGIDRHMV